MDIQVGRDTVWVGQLFRGGLPGRFHDPRSPARPPVALVKYLYATRQCGSASADEDAMVRIADILRTGPALADKRAALFRSLALIPGVEVTKQQATLNGQIGEREVLSKARGDVPRGTVIKSTSVSVSIGNHEKQIEHGRAVISSTHSSRGHRTD
jgi:hypothetical protein